MRLRIGRSALRKNLLTTAKSKIEGGSKEEQCWETRLRIEKFAPRKDQPTATKPKIEGGSKEGQY